MAKFRYLVLDNVTSVYFRGYWADAELGKNDDFSLRTGISIALFRAMKMRLLNGKNSDAELEMSGALLDIPLFKEGLIDNWQQWAARYIAYMAYHRGEKDGEKLPAGTSVAMGTYGIILFGVGDLLDDDSHLSPEESFVKTHKPSFSLAE